MTKNGFLINFVIEKLEISKGIAPNVNNILIKMLFDGIELNIPFQERNIEFPYYADQPEKIKGIPLSVIFSYKTTGGRIAGPIGEAICEWPENLIENLYEKGFDYYSSILNSDITHNNLQIGYISINVMLRKICVEGLKSLPDHVVSEYLMEPYLNDLQKCSKDILFFIDENTNTDMTDCQKRNLSCNPPDYSKHDLKNKGFIQFGGQTEYIRKKTQNCQNCEKKIESQNLNDTEKKTFDIYGCHCKTGRQRKLSNQNKDEIYKNDEECVRCIKFGNVDMQKNPYHNIVKEFELLVASTCSCRTCRLKRKFFKQFKKYLLNVQTKIGEKTIKPTEEFHLKLKKIVKKINKQYQKAYDLRDTEKQCLEILKKKSMLKKKKIMRKIRKLNSRKKRMHAHKYCYSFGDNSRITSFGHKDCVSHIPPVPANMGWMWNTDTEANRSGWKPGAVTVPVKDLMSYFLRDYPIDNLPVSSNKKGKPSQFPKQIRSYSQVHLTEKNGEYILNFHPAYRQVQETACKSRNMAQEFNNRKNYQSRLSGPKSESRGACNDAEKILNINLIQSDSSYENTAQKNIDVICAETQYEDADWNMFKKNY